MIGVSLQITRVRGDPMDLTTTPPPTYGLDIETDTTTGGLDPATAAIVAVALAGDGWQRVFDGPEHHLLTELDTAIRELDPGVLVTWNGSRFDLPFLADRANLHDQQLGLRIVADRRFRTYRDPLPGHEGGYVAAWYHHQHLDAYQVYRRDVGASLGLPCGLKPLARMVGLRPVEVDRENIHRLSAAELAEYVASDAVLTRELALRRWANACRSIDQLT
ncbi:MAG: hypothetical protein EX269_06845 [Acidimicrobiales bacterium]|nr:MAG: hypothetical protein EX269_06845 [Acidimicrobiales bacterium]